MVRLILNRIKVIIPMLIIVSIIAFGLLELAPGDPADAYINPLMSMEDIALVRENMGLDKPVYIRYFNWAKNTLKGNFGVSYINHMSVAPQILEKFINTLILMGTSLLFSILISIPLGTLLALKKNSLLDKIITGVSYIGLSLPSFWIGMIMIAIFSVRLGWLPTGGMYTIGNEGIFDLIRHLVLPVITLSLYNTAVFINYIRTSVEIELKEDYIITAKAKGLSTLDIILRHVLKNSLTSLVTILGMSIQRLVTGAFVTEVVFSWPGMGRFMIDSIFTRDYPVIMAITMISSLFLIGGNLLADILYLVIDPRVKVAKGGF